MYLFLGIKLLTNKKLDKSNTGISLPLNRILGIVSKRIDVGALCSLHCARQGRVRDVSSDSLYRDMIVTSC